MPINLVWAMATWGLYFCYRGQSHDITLLCHLLFGLSLKLSSPLVINTTCFFTFEVKKVKKVMFVVFGIQLPSGLFSSAHMFCYKQRPRSAAWPTTYIMILYIIGSDRSRFRTTTCGKAYKRAYSFRIGVAQWAHLIHIKFRLTSKLFLRSESCLLLVSALLTPCPLSLRPWHALQKEINNKQKYQSRWWGYNDTIENINDQIKNKKHMRYSTWAPGFIL